MKTSKQAELLRPWGAGREGRAGDGGGKVGQEGRRLAAAGQDELLLGAGHADKEEAALLGNIRVLAGRRQNILLKPRQKNHGKFKTLGRMERHQPHRTARMVFAAAEAAKVNVLSGAQYIQKSGHGIRKRRHV